MDTQQKGRLLVFDDSDSYRRELASALENHFDVVIVKGGDEAVALCEHWLPDVLVLDIENHAAGVEACRQLRALCDVPIIFATIDTTLDGMVVAFDAGASDLLVKPVVEKVLINKVQLAVQNRRRQLRLETEQADLESMAMDYLSSLSARDVLMNFARNSIRCRTFEELADKVVGAVHELQLSCFGEIRHEGGAPVRFRSSGNESPLEQSILSQLSSMGRQFQFRSQMVVNFPQISIVLNKLPINEPEKIAKIRDNITILAETADGLCENVQMRHQASAHAEQLQLALMRANQAVTGLQETMNHTLLDTRLLLQDLADNVQKAYAWLGTSTDQEAAISNMMEESIQRILARISQDDISNQIEQVFGSLQVTSTDDVELF